MNFSNLKVFKYLFINKISVKNIINSKLNIFYLHTEIVNLNIQIFTFLHRQILS